jgi:hypothetical protein
MSADNASPIPRWSIHSEVSTKIIARTYNAPAWDGARSFREEIRVLFLQPSFHPFTQFTNCFDEIVGFCVRNQGRGFVGNRMAFHATAIQELRKLTHA